MVVVTGIRTAIKLFPVIFKGAKIVYKAAKKTRAGDRYLARHPKIIKAGTIAATGGTLIYDLLNIDYDSLVGTNPSRDRKQQARSYFQSPRTRQFLDPIGCVVPRRRRRKQGQFYRSRYR